MNLPAFFADAIPEVAGTARLDREESRHALAVLRLRVGAEIRLLDGKGTLARARVTGSPGSLVECAVLERKADPPRLPRVHVGSALPKGERQNVLLDMATQLGMASFTPLACARGVAAAHAAAYARWERVCRAACKQALVRHLPELRPAAAPADFVRGLCAAGARVVLADRTGAATVPLDDSDGDIGLIVGPEGGFTDEEREAMVAACARPLRLAAHVLRVETAVVSGLALLQHRCGTD
jgi:16S rRNA (uracil1498-N3)-methyltransferase